MTNHKNFNGLQYAYEYDTIRGFNNKTIQYMKVNYFAYYFNNTSTRQRVSFNISPFLASFSEYAPIKFKSKFKHEDEKVFIKHIQDDVFLFLITRNEELLRKINTQNLSIARISEMLSTDEQIGFASYLIIKNDFLGIGSTVFAPKIDMFAEYINNIFHALNIKDWNFNIHAIMKQATPAEALNMAFIGRTSIEVKNEGTFIHQISSLFGADARDTIDISSIEIIIKPKPKKDIKRLVNKAIEKVDFEESLKRMHIKARTEAASNLIDIYLNSEGAISDMVNHQASEATVCNSLESKLSSNTYLMKSLKEYRAYEQIPAVQIDSIHYYNQRDSWASVIPTLSEVG